MECVTWVNVWLGMCEILKGLCRYILGQQKETLLMTYKAVGRSIINYAAPVWSPNLHTNYRKIQYTQNDHLHTEAEMQF